MAIKINGNTVIADNQAFTTTSTISATGNITTAGSFVGNLVSSGPVSTTGNVTGGNILTGGVVSAAGNITGNFILGNGSQLTGIDATSIQSGTSNVRVVSSGGNVAMGIGGTSNVVVVATTGQFVTGVTSVSGNVTGGNILTGGLISATGTITGGNIATAGTVSATGNITAGNVSATNLSGSLTTAAQANITSVGTLSSVSVTGNVQGGNIRTAGSVSATGNITGSNLTLNGNAVITGNLNVQGTETIFNVANLTVNDKDIIVANNVTGGANVDGSGLQAGNPATATWFFNNATTSWQSNIGITPTANGTLSLGGASNYWGNAFLTTATVTGNVQGGNIRTAGLISATGAITTGGDLSLTGNIVDAAALTVSTGSNGNITLAPNGTGVVVVNTDIRNGQANGVGNIGSASTYFNTIFAKATSAQYADLAEKYTADAEYAPGTVLVFGGSAEVTVDATDADPRVAGVVSTNPSYIMNAGCAGTNVATVALTGRVPCLVTGSVRKGDLMVAAGLGRARAEADPKVGTVIGKALENHDGAEGTIEVVVGRF
jgi:hypothetical protein